VEEGRYVANRIPGARFVELPGEDHLPFVGDQDAILDEIEEFVTGTRHALHPEPALATVMVAQFRVPGMRELRLHSQKRLRDHITRELAWFRGREFNPDGECLRASFDGPARAIRCACAIAYHASTIGVEVSVGLHIGECEISRDGIRGRAIDIANRIQSSAEPGEILTSATVRDLVAGSGIAFHLKGSLPVDEIGAALPLLSVERNFALQASA
jgi:hypothetical protein